MYFIKNDNERKQHLGIAKDYIKMYYTKNLKGKLEENGLRTPANIKKEMAKASTDSFHSTASLDSLPKSSSPSLVQSLSENSTTTTGKANANKSKQVSIFKKWADNKEKPTFEALIDQEIKNYSQCDWSYGYDATEDNDDKPPNPLEFYRIYEKGKNFKVLPILARHFFCIPATSVPTESLFSRAGQIATDLRNRIHFKRLEMYTFIKNNRSI
jgi:hypothetical protein